MSDKTMITLLVVFFVALLGQSHAFDIQSKIIGGTKSNADEIPFFVALSRENVPHCSASLLNDRYEYIFELKCFILIFNSKILVIFD